MTPALIDLFIDPRFEDEYRRQPLVLVDVGARGGLKRNWAAARRHLRVIGFEPDSQELARLTGTGASRHGSDTFFGVALHNRPGPIKLHLARDRGLSSIFEPDRSVVDAFPQADRFDTTAVQEIQADTLDHVVEAHAVSDVDFIKADTQGSELFVLQGAERTLRSSVLGVEVEAEFTPIYRNQPLFADVDAFLRERGFLLFDLRPVYWKRNGGRNVGGPWGQIIWADALYLKGLSAVKRSVADLPAESRKGKTLKAASIALLYGYFDYALEIVDNSGDVLARDERALIRQRLQAYGRRRGVLPQFPGKRLVRGALHRLWNACRDREEGWSISGAKLGNPD